MSLQTIGKVGLSFWIAGRILLPSYDVQAADEQKKETPNIITTAEVIPPKPSGKPVPGTGWPKPDWKNGDKIANASGIPSFQQFKDAQAPIKAK